MPDRSWVATGRRRSCGRLYQGVPYCSEAMSSQAAQVRGEIDAGLAHDHGAVIFNGALADPEVGSDVLAGMARRARSYTRLWRAVRSARLRHSIS